MPNTSARVFNFLFKNYDAINLLRIHLLILIALQKTDDKYKEIGVIHEQEMLEACNDLIKGNVFSRSSSSEENLDSARDYNLESGRIEISSSENSKRKLTLSP